MKKVLLFVLFAATPFLVKAQCNANVTTTNVTCYNACNGTATVVPLGGTPPFSYAWSPIGQTTQTATGLCAGTYTCYVLDSLGCVSQVTAVITQPGQISITYTMQPETCTSCCDGSATAVVTGGNAPFTYNWIPSGGTAATATGLCPGTYSVTATDASGCAVGTLVTIISVAGVQDQSGAGNFDVFPNPASGYITVEKTFAKSTPTEITLTNLLGEVIYVRSSESSIEMHQTIDLSALPNGLYFISVKTNTGISTRRFIKE